MKINSPSRPKSPKQRRPYIKGRARPARPAQSATHTKRLPRFKPRADVRLKPVLATIGIPSRSPFIPDPFQVEAVKAISHADCLVAAPTGAGKTWIAEQAIARVHENGGRSWYASPLKALSNAKFIEFSQSFGPSNTGILTGDRKENPDAAVIVGTTEILRNQLYDAMQQGQTLATDLVILDEAHYLGDEDRGVVWEEIMIYLPLRVPLLMLSATIGNAPLIAAWLSQIRSKQCRVVTAAQRPVPLFPLCLHPKGTLLPLLGSSPADPNSHAKSRKVNLDYKVQNLLKAPKRPSFAAPGKSLPYGKILGLLRKFHLLPAIFFLKSRADCDRALDMCEQQRSRQNERQSRRSQQIAALIHNRPHIAKHRQLHQLEHLAVAAHHSGQLPSWKLMIERLMSNGHLDAVFATSTVAAGVNFPARTIVMLNSDRFNGREFLPLTSTEFHQMTGRAGRRGMDKIGFAMLIPGKFMDLRAVAQLVDAPPGDVLSQIRINFAMVLNLLSSHRVDQIQALLEKSFATFLLSRAHKSKTGSPLAIADIAGGHLWRDFNHHLQFLKRSGFVSRDDQLTENGVWAAQLRIDQPLLVAEGLRHNRFPDADPALLAAVIAALVNERETREAVNPKWISDKLLSAFWRMEKGLEPFANQLAQAGFEVRPLFFRPAVAIYQWCCGMAWEQVLHVGDASEGDLAMLILRTADNLRHIRALKTVFPAAARTAGAAMDLLLREPVKSDYGF